jgi:hypothetical protein
MINDKSNTPESGLHEPTCDVFVNESQRVQWWLGKLDRHDNVVELTDGAHSEAAGAHEAMYLLNRLGLTNKDTKYAVVRCEIFKPIPDGSRVNQDALKTLNDIGLNPNNQPTQQ